MLSPKTLIVGRPIYSRDRDCGYCHGSKTNSYALQSYRDHYHGTEKTQVHSVTIGMSLQNISYEDYETLCNKGFRRSGTFLYKPDLLRNCCRLYTIRTSYEMFKMNKDQRKSMNRFFKVLKEEATKKPKSNETVDSFKEFESFETNIDPKVFRTKIDSAKFTEEKFELYKKYQVEIHKDTPDKLSANSFKRFLCDNPFHEPVADNKPMGHVHELYYIHDELAAIAVLDILPNGISSVYFIWDPKYAKLGLGKISSLREMNLCKKLGKQWYYLGYYIPDCEKMKYKSKFGGELLDVSDYQYYKIQDLVKSKILDQENDYLFLVGKDEGDARKEEKFIEYDETKLFKSKVIIKDQKNVADEIYQFNENDNKDRELEVEHEEELLFKFPDRVPGLIPMAQVKTDRFNLILENLKINIYDPFDKMVVYNSGDDLERDQIILDLVRILGLSIMNNSIVVVY